MQKQLATILLACALFAPLGGCGKGADAPPPQAVMHKLDPPAPPEPANHVWTKEEKIAIIQKSPIPDAQKQAAIAKVNAGG